MALEKILTDGSETGGSSADKINLGFDATDANTTAINGTEVINDSITKTVGVGKDFETLHLALRWAENTSCYGKGHIDLVLDDGLHAIGGEGELHPLWWVYYQFNNTDMKITSASGNKANCVITMDAFDDGDQYGGLIVGYYSYITFERVTFDMAIGGYPYPNNVQIFGNYSGCTFKASTTDFKSGYVYFDQGLDSFLTNTILDVCPLLNYATKASFRNVTMRNNVYAAYSSYDGAISLTNGINFSNNGTDINIPLNEIQEDGGYITDGSEPLSFSGSGQQDLPVAVYNDSGATIPAASAVRSEGGETGGFPNVVMAQADSLLNAKVMGITKQDILPGQSGEVVSLGLLEGIDTSGWGAGKYLYLSETIPGGITTDSPSGIISTLGMTLISSVSGSMMVAISNFRSLPIAYASMTGGSAGTTIGAAWTDFSNYLSSNDVIMTSNLLTGEISCNINGSYEIDTNININFDATGNGASRPTLSLRLVGDLGYMSPEIPLGLQNGSSTATFTPTMLENLVAGEKYKIQISSDIDVNNVVYSYIFFKIEAKHLELDI